MKRRSFLATAVAFPAILRAKKSTDVKIKDISYGYEDYSYRTPIKFGGSVVDKVTLLNVNVVLESNAGKTAKGFGSMPLGNVWSFPSKVLKYEQTLEAMKALATEIHQITAAYKEPGHPIDLNHALEPEYLKAADKVNKALKLQQPIPKLCTLVTASPFDAAVHDGFGKMLGRSAYQTYGPDLMSNDLSHYLNADFKGETLDRYVLKAPKPKMPLYHLVGAVDPITASDINKRVGDGLPETLPEWINYSGLSHLKIKLNGEDILWDVNRVLAVERAAAEAQAKRGVSKWVYSLDFNEKCPNVQYLLGFMRQVKEKAPAAFDRIQYIEQPTARDLRANRQNKMQEAAKVRPVVIDESLTDLEALLLSREIGYTGVALKACKGQSQAVLMGAAAQKYKMFLCVQDLTCPGASLIHSAGLAAHVPTVAAIECNSRQYVPVANKGWDKRFPGVFDVRDGYVNTGLLNKNGLSAAA
ncbi:MAG: mandelate racemase/muconate lactonizing enzyme family protein [Bryobacterales bacterium]|nr:mandelate racemase/muconate lactonizing enzyme family protein [Bryobacterales bacterium]